MSVNLRLITRIALFAALIYVLSWGTSYFPNVNLVFFIVFTAGFLWGAVAGILVGAVGMGLWTTFNPYGPAAFSIMLAQVGGITLSGLTGFFFRKSRWSERNKKTLITSLVLVAVVCTCLFYLPVNVIDAWIYQPFWPRFITGMLWSLVSVAANMIIFPLLFPVTRYLYDRERISSW
ncbi:MAG: ECF transporter S component [candidate division Zixibacteria bacterium]|nr:ECF transporter S component [candidate division Zixibacteria bacterium]